MTRDTLITPVRIAESGSFTSRDDLLAVEEPLEIRLNGRPLSITMRTPGHDIDLACGFVFTEGIVEDMSHILSIAHANDAPKSRLSANSVLVELKPEVELDSEALQRNFYTTSSCGICGKASITALAARPRRPLPDTAPVIAAAVVHRLPSALREAQPVFDRTGGIHAAALFSAEGKLFLLREDIGRHNAVDKVIGSALRDNCRSLHESLMFVSGRAGFELVQKTLMAGIPILAAVGAPSSLAVETARRFGMTLLGFVRGGRFNIYSGDWRIQ